MTDLPENSHIAIVGMQCRVPGAENVNQFWSNLVAGTESISFSSPEELRAAGVEEWMIRDPHFVPAWALLEGTQLFDAAFFGFSPREAELMDPQQRIFMETAWHALESAGYNPHAYAGRIGLYAGLGNNEYLSRLFANAGLVEAVGRSAIIIANDRSSIATATSYRLNLQGPSIAVQAACSTSLVAVHVACQALLEGECDMALAGGVAVSVPEMRGYLYEEGGVLSSDGHCRAFDDRANGMVGGNGVCIVVLKRLNAALRDGDYIRAVIRGSAINNDGSGKIGYTAPSIDGQAKAILMAQTIAEVNPETISYVEAHGTGTALGDPIEVAALTKAFRTSSEKRNFCALGSVKTNIGHLDTAAGAAGLIKTVLALEHKQIPASLNFQKPNRNLDFDGSPFFVNTELRKWTGPRPLRAGVSSFGVGGTNAHVVLEEAPEREPSGTGLALQLLVLSARSESALQNASAHLAQHFKQDPDVCLADVAFTLQTGRKHFSHRRAVVCSIPPEPELLRDIEDPGRGFNGVAAKVSPEVIFLFPGQGSQAINMARGLYEHQPFFKAVVDRCCERLKPWLGLDLRQVLYPETPNCELAAEQLKQTAMAQPALFVIEYALAQLWMYLGVKPRAMIGHSLGEYVAACLSGVMSEDQALAFIAARGQLMQETPPGRMLAVSLSEDHIQQWLGPGISLAAVNANDQCTLSGALESILDLEQRLSEKGIVCRQLDTTRAFHSSMMDAALERFQAKAQTLSFAAPTLPFISNLTGNWIDAKDATDPGYWVRHLREPVRFADGIDRIAADLPDSIWLEVGPGQTLTGLARRRIAGRKPCTAATLAKAEPGRDLHSFVQALGKIWVAGANIDWTALHSGERRYRLPLPVYPFERKRYWVDSPSQGVPRESASPRPSVGKSSNVSDWFYIPVWKQAPISKRNAANGMESIEFLFFANHTDFGNELASRLENLGCRVTFVHAGPSFASASQNAYQINPRQPEDYKELLSCLEQQNRSPERVVYLWNTKREAESSQPELQEGIYGLLFLAQALRQNSNIPVEINAISNDLHAITGEENITAEESALLGLSLVIGQEFPHLRCRNIDIAEPRGRFQKDNLVENVAAEILGSGESLVAYRGGHRWVRVFERLELQPDSSAPVSLRDRGVYLLTGGLGKIGLAVAAYLTRTVRARLVLVGRSFFPSVEDWDQWLSAHPETDAISQKIQKLRQFQALGSEVLVIAADVGDAAQMVAVIDQAHERFGPIHGIIHAAGWVGGNSLPEVRETTAETLETHFHSKVDGVRVLEQCTAHERLDFCVLFSSLSSVLGGLGFCAYSAASTAMDAYAHARQFQSSTRWTTINWEGWDFDRDANGGVTKAGSVREYSLLPEQGVEAFHRILQIRQPVCQVIVSTGDLPTRLDQWVQGQQKQKEPVSIGSSSRSEDSRSTTAEHTVRSEIADIWRQLLGVQEIGIHDNFFELGGNSLIAIRVLSQLRQRFRKDISLDAIFNCPTIEHLAADIFGETVVPERNRTEELIINIWRDVIGVVQIAPSDNFFEIGGNSLMAIKVLSRLRQALGSEIPIETIFNCLTPAALAQALEQKLDQTKTEKNTVQSQAHSQTGALAEKPVLTRKEERPEPLPLSYPQQRLWFIDRLEKTSTQYHLPAVLHLKGKLNVKALEWAMNRIVSRHEILRTRFPEIEGEPSQLIEPDLPIHVVLEDLTHLDGPTQQPRIQMALASEWERPFNLLTGPLLRSKVLKLGEQDHIFLITFHHIISDGWSYGVFNRELAALYQAFIEGRSDPLPALTLQYADFTLWQRELVAHQRLQEEEHYWQQQLSGIPDELQLPRDRPRGRLQTFEADICRVQLSAEQIKRLRDLAFNHQATVHMVMLSLLAVLLHRYSGQDDIVVGTPIANRPEKQLEDLIGCFVNVLAMRVKPKTECTFSQLLMEVRAFTLGAYDHPNVPFERLVELLAPERALNKTPLYQVTFALHNMPMGPPALPEIEVNSVLAHQPKLRFDLELQAWDQEKQISLMWIYNRDLFDGWRIQKLAMHYLKLLEETATRPDVPLCQLDLLDDQERRQILAYGSGAQAALDPTSLCSLFETQASNSRNATAVIWGDERITFDELNSRANRLARHLRAWGVAPEVTVGIAMESSIELLTALLGVLKAGGAYVPVDMENPIERITVILEDCAAPLILTTSRWRNRLPSTLAHVIGVDEEQEALAMEASENLAVVIEAESPAYVLYTSGSSGKPKGVVMTHRGLMNYLMWAIDAYRPDAGEGAAVHTSISFDLAVTSIFLPLLSGKPVILTEENSLQGLIRIVRTRRNFSFLKLTPTHLLGLNNLLDATEVESPPGSLILGGEALHYETLREWRNQNPTARLFNEYGPTEAAVGCCVYEAHSGDPETGPVPIGRPIRNVCVYVLDKNLNLIPEGVIGELYVAGESLARGYLNQSALTAQRFVADPFSKTKGSRMYRTGDVACWRSDGVLQFFGRVDQQVKIRGFRVELEEIQSVLRNSEFVQDAIAMLHQQGEQQQLRTFVVLRRGAALQKNLEDEALKNQLEQSLRERLMRALPSYMVPASIVVLDAWPLTQNGKVDYAALLKLEGASQAAIARAPQSAEEQILCSIFADVLERESVGVDDDFFALGGHSLTATRVISRIRTLLGIDLELNAIFEWHTVATLAAHIENYQQVSHAAEYASPVVVKRG
jgi:amino acid adenylation domain-containing protein